MSPAVPALFELNAATVWRGGRAVLDGIDLRIEQGQHCAILGPNGCGKTTLVRLLHRELHPLARSGEPPPIRVLGASRWNVFDLRRAFGLVSGDLQRDLTGIPGLDVYSAVLAGFYATALLPLDAQVSDAQHAAVEQALAQLGLAAFARRRLVTLSLGEMRRVLIARALIHRPHTLLLDEPTTGLDPGARFRLLDTLAELAANGVALVLVTHHLDEVLPCVTRVVLMKHGRIEADGSRTELLTAPRLAALYDMPVAALGDGFASAGSGHPMRPDAAGTTQPGP